MTEVNVGKVLDTNRYYRPHAEPFTLQYFALLEALGHSRSDVDTEIRDRALAKVQPAVDDKGTEAAEAAS